VRPLSSELARARSEIAVWDLLCLSDNFSLNTNWSFSNAIATEHHSDYSARCCSRSERGATFRVWAPRAKVVYLNPDVAADGSVQLTEARRMSKDASGCWSAFEPDAGDGFLYRYYVVGNATSRLRKK
jgi:1,4-alpha-glucan branching enzyme